MTLETLALGVIFTVLVVAALTTFYLDYKRTLLSELHAGGWNPDGDPPSND
ncbi:MAG: hypothetical protein ABEJ28_13240 [Salinigranum sp.]